MNEKIEEDLAIVLDHLSDKEELMVCIYLDNPHDIYLGKIVKLLRIGFARFEPKDISFITSENCVRCVCTKQAIINIYISGHIVKITQDSPQLTKQAIYI